MAPRRPNQWPLHLRLRPTGTITRAVHFEAVNFQEIEAYARRKDIGFDQALNEILTSGLRAMVDA